MPDNQFRKIVVYGAGGFGREIAWLAQSCNECEVVAVVDDDPKYHGKEMNGIPVMSLGEAKDKFFDASVLVAVGSPQIREKITKKVRQEGLSIGTLIHPRTEMSPWIEMGEGAVICAGCILTTNIKMGNHVQINLDCTIGHDVIMDDYATLAPGVHVSGYVYLGKRVYVGTGAVFLNGTKENPLIIGDDVIIGAGACVTKSVTSGIWGGVPARELGKPRS